MSEDAKQGKLSDQDLDKVAGGAGDDEAEDSVTLDYGAVKIDYTTTNRASRDDVVVDGKVRTGE